MAAWLTLAAVALAFFWQLALTNQIMVGVDIFTYFYPYRSAVNEALLQGRLPLWNPYLYMGVPLLANGQAGIFYPLNWLFLFLPAPLAVNGSIVLHVVLAAVFFHLFARQALGLSNPAAFVAACVFAFSGYAGSLVEHVNQLQAAVWFPLLLVCLHRMRPARRSPPGEPEAGESSNARSDVRDGESGTGRRTAYVLLGGLLFAFQLLAGHVQVSFITIFGMGLWVAARQRWPSVRPLLPPRAALVRMLPALREFGADLASLLGIGLIGAALAAMQLVPMLELARLSIRAGGMTYREAVAFSLPPQSLLESLLPTFGIGEALSSEYIGFIGVAALILAALGVRRFGRVHPGLLLLLAAGLALSLGLYDPLYFVLFKLVPGFGLFRVPARWLFLSVLAAAGFAGLGIESVWAGRGLGPSRLRWQRPAMVAVVVVLAITVLARLRIIAAPPFPVAVLWLVVGLAVVFLVRAVAAERSDPAPRRVTRRRVAGLALGALVLVELFVATRWLPYTQLTAPEAWSSLRPSIAYLLSDGVTQPFRMLSYSDLTWDPGDLHDIEAMFAGQLLPRAIYEYTVAAKAKEIVAPNLALRYHLQSVDGYDGGVLPLARFVGLEGLLLSPDQVNPDGRLRERLRAPPATRWLDLFNVRYLIADKVFDVWVDGIYYDLGMGLQLRPGDPRLYPIAVPPSFAATGIGMVSSLSGAAALPNDTPVAELVATDVQGLAHSFIVRAGRETAEAVYDKASVAHAQARAVHSERGQPAANEYHALLTLPAATQLSALSVRSLLPAGIFSLRGLSLIDSATGTGVPLTFASDGQFRLAHSGDVKLYERIDAPPRALVIHRTAIVADDSSALTAMALPDFDPGTQLLLSAGKVLNGTAAPIPAVFNVFEPERLVMHTDDGVEGYLLIKDAWYPGWHAWVDGSPALIERADTYFRAVYLGPGSHTVELRFEPESLKIGGAISLGAMLFWVAAALVYRKRYAARRTS